MILRLSFIVSLLATVPASAEWKFSFYEPVQPARKVQVMVHRGMRMLAPENSLKAILACADDYIEWAEIDVRLTKDGQHVVIHNATVGETTDGHGNVSDLTLEELKKLDSGAWFSSRSRGTRLQSLAEVLAATKNRVNLYLDCKRIDPDLLVREIRHARMESQVVVYAGPDVLAKIRSAAGNDVATMAKFRPKETQMDEFLMRINPVAVEIDASDVTRELCEQFHRRGIKVQAKVLGSDVDVPTVWNRMIDFGVDWLQTDDPVGVRFAEVRKRIPKFPVQFACHRGANLYAPENSLPAIRLAAAIGADYIEIDIRTTLDGQFVLVHDGTLNRTTNGTGPVKQQNLTAILALDCGAWFGKPFTGLKVPRFSEGLDAMGIEAHAYLDAKDIAPEALIEAIQKHNLLTRHAVYQSAEYCQKLKALDPTVRLMPPLRNAESLNGLLELKPYAVDANWKILSQDLIARCHAANIRVFSDALGAHETVEHYRQAIDWGIDVIQTDFPLRVLRAIELTAGK